MRNLKQINSNFSIDQNQLLGKGSTGNVYLGYSSNNSIKKYAVKAIDLAEVNNQVTQYLLSCQIVALTQLAKQNLNSIVKLQDISFFQNHCYLVMELLEGGPLSQYIKSKPQGLPQSQVISLFTQLIQGYKAIKKQGIVHRDIKPDNIIFRQNFQNDFSSNNNKNISFIDFGYCTVERVPNRPKVYYNVGSPKYMSPQAYRENIYSQKSDIWALGIILYEMIHGKTIDTGMQMDEYMQFMRSNPIPLTKNVGMVLRKLLVGMLNFNYRNRFTCQDIQEVLNLVKQNQQNKINLQNSPQNILSLMIGQSPQKNLSFLRPTVNQTERQNIIIRNNNSFQNPRRLYRNFSHQNSMNQYRQSPKKIIQLQNVQNKFINKSLIFSNQTPNLFLLNSNKSIPETPNPLLQKIVEEDNQNQHFKIHKDIFILGGIKRIAKQGQIQMPNNQNPPKLLKNSHRFNYNTPSRQGQLFNSQIFNSINKTNNRKNVFFNSQTYDKQENNKNIQIKVLNYGTQQQRNQNQSNVQAFKSSPFILHKQLNKSFSSNNVHFNNQNKLQMIRIQPKNYFPQKKYQKLQSKAQKNLQAIINKNFKNNDAKFLRNTMPIFRSTIFQSQLQSNPISHQFGKQSIIEKKWMSNTNTNQHFVPLEHKTVQLNFRQNQKHPRISLNNNLQSQFRDLKSNSFKINPLNVHEQRQNDQAVSAKQFEDYQMNPQQVQSSQIIHINKNTHLKQINNQNFQSIQINNQFMNQNSKIIQNQNQRLSFDIKKNNINQQQIRRSYMIHQVQQEKKIPTFILNNNLKGNQNNNKAAQVIINNPNIRPFLIPNQPQKSQFVVIKPQIQTNHFVNQHTINRQPFIFNNGEMHQSRKIFF